jgi:hypothetical protein
MHAHLRERGGAMMPRRFCPDAHAVPGPASHQVCMHDAPHLAAAHYQSLILHLTTGRKH